VNFMPLNYLQMIILYCLDKLNGERTIYSIYHLLNGKKSSQTIQDAHLFQLGALFQTCPSLERADLDENIKQLENQGWIRQEEELHYSVTDEGASALEAQLQKTPVPTALNGWKLHDKSALFWERLSLLVQVVSQLNHNNPHYIPIQRRRAAHIWLKKVLREAQMDKRTLAAGLYSELEAALESCTEVDPAILVLRLTGAGHIGLTPEQAAEALNMDRDHYRFCFLSILHYLIVHIMENRSSFPVLRLLFTGEESSIPLTLSAQKTYMMLKQGVGMERIILARGLKRSTIEDHIVELALNVEGFSIDPYVQKEKQELIRQAAMNAESRQLKHIRRLAGNAEYFEIRLVMAKYGDGNEA
jgi:uncharacterized protein YpbB